MKKIALYAVLIVSFVCKAQDYTPLLTDQNEWHFTTCYLGDCTRDSYYTIGDEVVNGITYKRLDGYHYISGSFLLREDVVEQQVFLLTIVNGTQRENLLYDFSMEVGDEIEMRNPFTPFPENGGMFTLTSIENLPLVDGNDYKHYYLSPSPGNTTSSWDAVWVEGVGSLSILTSPGGEPNFDEVGELSCSFRNGVSFYANLERLNECESQLGVPNNDAISNVVFISEVNNLRIENTNEVSEISLFTIEGKLVQTIANSPNASTVMLSTEHLNNGIYILGVITTTGVASSHQVIIK